jgi:hypothetical protein
VPDSRLEELRALLNAKHAPHKEQQLLHEALDLCEDLGLSMDWRIFKKRLERLQRSAIENRKKG